jgi:hypothetical protein
VPLVRLAESVTLHLGGNSSPFCSKILALLRGNSCQTSTLERLPWRLIDQVGAGKMASERQFEANRKNAKRSTGPKTRAGKARSSRNALRHGLARTTIANEVPPGGLIAALISSVNHSMQLEDAKSLVR